MVGFFSLTPKRQKRLHKFFSAIAIFSLFLQIGSGIFYYQPVLAEEQTAEPTPVVEQPAETPTEVTPTSENNPIPEAPSNLEITPTPTPIPIVTPTPIESLSLPQYETPLDLGKPIEDPTSGQIAPTPTPIEKVCSTNDQQIIDTTNENWEINSEEGWAQTREPVKLGVKYVYPQENKVTITFKCLPKDEGLRTPLKIQKVKISDLKLPEGTNPYGEYAYDITTDMQDRTFEYDVTLPKPADQIAEVSYIEKSAEEIKSQTGPLKEEDLKTIEEEKISQDGEAVKASELDHFTIFVVVVPNQTVTSSSVTNAGNGWVSDDAYALFNSSSDTADYGFPDLGIPSGATIEGIEVFIEGKTTGRNLTAALWNTSDGTDAYTTAKTASLGASDTTQTLGSPTDKWGKTWTSADFSDANFKVRVGATSGNNTASLDQVQVKVYYTPLADLTATKTHTPSGNATINQAFTWNIRVQNGGNADAVFSTGNTILTDNLQSSNVTYGSPTVTKSDATVLGTINCSISSNNLSCTAGDQVTIPVTKYFDVSFSATFSTTGSKANPRSGGICKVDPLSPDAVDESNEGNNTCSESVTVDPLRPDLVVTKTNNVSGNTIVNQSFEWTLTVTNNGLADASFSNENILEDDLPSSGATYSPTSNLPVTTSGGVTGSIDCDISSSTLDCDDNSGGDPVVIPPGGSFSLTINVTPTATGTLSNPRSGSGNICRVDPDTKETESNETNNDCLDSVTVQAYQVVPNPSLTQACGLDIALVIDNSNSIDSTELGQMKTAMTGFVNALAGTPTQFSVTKFGTDAFVVQGFTSNTSNVNSAINGISTGGGGTDWMEGIATARGTFGGRPDKPNLMIFASDGNPTFPNCGGSSTCPADVAAAVVEANIAKSSPLNIRILALGIGDNLLVDNLKAISGPNLNTGDVLTSDVITTDFSGLAAQLATFATQTCGGTITVNKYIDSVDPNNRGGAGWQFNIAGIAKTTDINGQTDAVNVPTGSNYSVIETNMLSGFHYGQASCTKNGSPVGSAITNGVGGISINDQDIISCNFVNIQNCHASQHTLEGQIKNDGYTTGNLCAGSGDCWSEGENVPARLTIQGVDVGVPYSVVIEHDYQDSGKTGYENFNSPTSGNGSANSISLGVPTVVPCGSGVTCKDYTLSFTPTNSTVQLDWNALLSNTAAQWPGASLHYRLITGACGGAGNKDIPLNPGKIIILGSITPTKSSANGANPSSWTFNISGNTNVNGVASGATASNLALNANNGDATYTITEVGPSGWILDSVTGPCQKTGDITAQVTLTASSPDVACTFTNKQSTGTLTLVKAITNDNGGDATPADFQAYINGNPVPWNVAQTLDVDSYTASESNLAGYSPSSWGDDCNTDGTVSLAGGENKTCSITNDDIAPTLTLVKTVTNNDGGAKNVSDFKVYIDGPEVSWGVAIPIQANIQHTVTESSLSGYAASVWGTDCSTDGKITLLPGENKTCTITNDDIAPTLTLVKQIIKDNGGQASATDWTLSATGIEKSFSGTTPVTGTVKANMTYALAESGGPSGYTASGWNCTGGGLQHENNITLDPGDNVTCTITNDDQAGTLIVKKVVFNDDGGTLNPENFSFQVDGGSAITFETDGQNDLVVNAGTYSVTEPTVGGYSKTYDNCSSLVVANGGSATCIITNDDVAPTLTLVKEVTNNDGGTATASAWTLLAAGSERSFSGSGPQVGPNNVKAGVVYALSETGGPSGYTASTWNCDGGSFGGNTITLGLSDEVTCTITNDDVAPTLTLVKTVVNDNGGNKVVANFPLFIDGNPATSGTAYPLLANTEYTASETNQTGYTPSVWGGDCAGNGTITLLPGDNKTCTITNDDVAPYLTLVKTVVNDNGGTATPSAWFLGANAMDDPNSFFGAGPTVGPHIVTAGTDYIISEAPGGPSGYLSSSWNCDGGQLSTNGVTEIKLGLGENVTCTITNDDEAPTLKLVKEVTNDNGGQAAAGDWTLNARTLCAFGPPNPACGFSDNGGSTTFHPLAAGRVYNLWESGPSGYTMGTWFCDGGSLTGNRLTLGLDEEVTCTITNDDISPQLTVIKYVINDSDGALSASDFTMNVTGENVSNSSFPGAEDPGTTVTLDAGSYSVDEADSFGYTKILGDNCSGTIAIGETKTCTITNDDIDAIPSIEVTKTANPTSVPETGGDVTYTFTVKNLSTIEPVTITSLSDSVFGTLAGDADCQVGTSLAVGASCDFSITRSVSGDYPGNHVNIFTAHAKDNENNDVSDDDDATVTYTDVLPDISVTKDAAQTSIPETGGNVTFTYVVYNNSNEAATITVLSDDKFGALTGDADCQVGTVLAGLASCSFEATFAVPVGDASNTHINVFSATVTDGDDNSDTATDDATITYVGANITLDPLSAANDVNDPHTLTATVTEDPGTGSVAAAGELVTFSLVNNTAGASFVSGNTCNTNASGQCTVQINSVAPGSVDVHGSVDVGVLSFTLHRETDGTLGSSGNAAKTYVAGRIVIEKQTLPDGSTQSFEFDPSWSVTNFNLTDGQTNDSGWLASGAHVVSETNPSTSGYRLISIDCDDANSIGDVQTGIASFNVEPGETVKCIFTNEIFGSITAHKYEDLNAGGTQDAGEPDLSGWTMSVYSGSDCQPGNFLHQYNTDGSGEASFYSIVPGQPYSVGEALQTGWTNISPLCQNVALNPGEQKQVEFGNFEKGDLHVSKYEDTDGVLGRTEGSEFWIGDPTFTFRVYEATSGGWLLRGQQDTDGGGAATFTDVFENLGNYFVCEVKKAGWEDMRSLHNPANNNSGALDEYSVCEGITVSMSGYGVAAEFGNIRWGNITVCKYDDYNNNGALDLNEPGINGVNINLRHLLPDGMANELSMDGITGDGENPQGCYTFSNLLLANYRITEDTNSPVLAGYQPSNGTSTTYDVSLTEGGQILTVNFFNHLNQIELLLSKTSAEIAGKTAGPGDTITYTLTITNDSDFTAFGVIVQDSLPDGFSYVAGTTAGSGWTASEPTISGNKLTWTVGNIAGGGEVIINYDAQISSSLVSGSYPNVAIASGSNRKADGDIAYSGFAEFYTAVGKGISYSTSVGGGFVLGAATGQVLGAATGSPTILLIMAILMILGGLVIYFRKGRKFHV